MCASEIIQAVARRAFRRPVTSDEIESLLIFFDAGRRDGQSFDSGIQFALERILVDPGFSLARLPRPG